LPAVALWLALFIGLSPTLVDLARHWLAEPWALPFACFVPLWLLCVHGDAKRSSSHRFGLLLVVAGVLLAAFAATGGSTRLGRYGIPAAVLGLALWLGRPSPARALLASWWIPVPNAVQSGLFAWLSAAAGKWLASGLAAGSGGESIEAGPVSLPRIAGVELGAGDLGVQLCWFLAGLGWYAAASRGAGVTLAAGAALRSGLLGIPLQMLALGAVAALALLGNPALARVWLDLFLPVVAICATIGLLHQRRRKHVSQIPALAGRGGAR
jgi:hypothetical protein